MPSDFDAAGSELRRSRESLRFFLDFFLELLFFLAAIWMTGGLGVEKRLLAQMGLSSERNTLSESMNYPCIHFINFILSDFPSAPR